MLAPRPVREAAEDGAAPARITRKSGAAGCVGKEPFMPSYGNRPERGMSSPAALFRHLQRLTDQVGVLEHARGIVPRHEHGYRVDDVARGLIVVCREPSPSQELVTLGRRYLYF